MNKNNNIIPFITYFGWLCFFLFLLNLRISTNNTISFMRVTKKKNIRKNNKDRECEPVEATNRRETDKRDFWSEKKAICICSS